MTEKTSDTHAREIAHAIMDVLSAEKDPNRVIMFFSMMISHPMMVSQPSETTARARACLHIARGLTYYRKKGDLDNAISDFGQAIELAPDIREAYQHRASVYDEKGEAELADADRKQAAKLKPLAG